MVKNLKLHYIKAENDDPHLMLLALRTTALENGHSPVELLMGGCLRALPYEELNPYKNTPLLLM